MMRLGDKVKTPDGAGVLLGFCWTTAWRPEVTDPREGFVRFLGGQVCRYAHDQIEPMGSAS